MAKGKKKQLLLHIMLPVLNASTFSAHTLCVALNIDG